MAEKWSGDEAYGDIQGASGNSWLPPTWNRWSNMNWSRIWHQTGRGRRQMCPKWDNNLPYCVRIVALYEAKGRPCRNSASFRKRDKYKRPTCDNNLEAEECVCLTGRDPPLSTTRLEVRRPPGGNQWASLFHERAILHLLPDRALSHRGREGGRHFVPPRETERKTGRQGKSSDRSRR